MKSKTNKQQAFTLIELLMVISIIGLLSSVVLGSLNDARDKARIAAGQQFDASTKHGIGDGLVGEWLFNNDTLDDTSGFGRGGTYEDGIGILDYVDRSVNRALNFNGLTARERINFSSFTITSEGTYSLWLRGQKTSGLQRLENIYPLGIQGQHSMLGPNGGITERFGLITRNASVNYYYDWGNQNLYDGKWHLYVVSWDSTKVYAYLDGRIIGSPKTHGGNIFTASGTLKAGAGWSDTYGTHNGDLDDVRIYSKSLTSAEVKKLYAEGVSQHILAEK